MRLSRILSLSALALAGSLASANAQQGVQVGVLDCRGGQSVGMILGSDTTLDCVFNSQGARPQRYTARVQRVGLDLGFTQQTQISWVAVGPAGRVPPGGLAGRYGGVGANASVGVGFGGNFLVSDYSRYALQPITVQGQTGLNVAAGFASVELVPVREPRRHRRH